MEVQKSRSRSSSGNPTRIFNCANCPYTSEKKTNLQRHIQTMHELAREFNCCGINFQNKADYRQHTRNVHRNGHACSICHRVFNRRALLTRHQNVHTGNREFTCDLCPYASSHKSNLERHMRIHLTTNTNPGKKQYQRKSSSKTKNDQSTPTLDLRPDSRTTSIDSSLFSTYIYPSHQDQDHQETELITENTSGFKSKSVTHSIGSILARPNPPKNPVFSTNITDICTTQEPEVNFTNSNTSFILQDNLIPRQNHGTNTQEVNFSNQSCPGGRVKLGPQVLFHGHTTSSHGPLNHGPVVSSGDFWLNQSYPLIYYPLNDGQNSTTTTNSNNSNAYTTLQAQGGIFYTSNQSLDNCPGRAYGTSQNLHLNSSLMSNTSSTSTTNSTNTSFNSSFGSFNFNDTSGLDTSFNYNSIQPADIRTNISGVQNQNHQNLSNNFQNLTVLQPIAQNQNQNFELVSNSETDTDSEPEDSEDDEEIDVVNFEENFEPNFESDSNCGSTYSGKENQIQVSVDYTNYLPKKLRASRTRCSNTNT